MLGQARGRTQVQVEREWNGWRAQVTSSGGFHVAHSILESARSFMANSSRRESRESTTNFALGPGLRAGDFSQRGPSCATGSAIAPAFAHGAGPRRGRRREAPCLPSVDAMAVPVASPKPRLPMHADPLSPDAIDLRYTPLLPCHLACRAPPRVQHSATASTDIPTRLPLRRRLVREPRLAHQPR